MGLEAWQNEAANIHDDAFRDLASWSRAAAGTLTAKFLPQVPGPCWFVLRWYLWHKEP